MSHRIQNSNSNYNYYGEVEQNVTLIDHQRRHPDRNVANMLINSGGSLDRKTFTLGDRGVFSGG